MAGLRPFIVRRKSNDFRNRLGNRTCPPECRTRSVLRPNVRPIERISAAWIRVEPRRLLKLTQPSSVTVISVGILGYRT